MGLTIRPWHKDDLASVRTITWQSWRSTYSSFVPETDLKFYFDTHYTETSLLHSFNDPCTRGYVAELPHRMVGYARLSFNRGENNLYVTSLYLLPEFEGKGIGNRLLNIAEEYAEEKGLDRLWIGVMVENRQALLFYRKAGFRFIREEPFHMGKTTVSHLIGYKRLGEEISLDQKIHTRFDTGQNLPERCDDLLTEQKMGWIDLRRGFESLEDIRMREVHCKRFSVRLQYHPGRIRSTTAGVGDTKENERPCFLCLDQLPEAQRGILYRNEFLILCNPMPVFPSHFTVSHLDHRHQAITEHIATFLHLIACLGRSWVVLYNGPRCGASAPDHLHFQIVPSGQMPIEKEILEKKRYLMVKKLEGVFIYRIRGLGREVTLLEGGEPAAMESALKNYLTALKRVLNIDGEPMINIAGLYGGTTFRLLLFPRRKHRPDAFFRRGEERIVVSPGAIDMGGLLITPVEKDFKRLNETTVESIYREVSLEADRVKSALRAME